MGYLSVCRETIRFVIKVEVSAAEKGSTVIMNVTEKKF